MARYPAFYRDWVLENVNVAIIQIVAIIKNK